MIFFREYRLPLAPCTLVNLINMVKFIKTGSNIKIVLWILISIF